MKAVLIIPAVYLLLLAGCGTGPDMGAGDEQVAPPAAESLTPAEQERAAFEVFRRILPLTRPPDRQANMPRIKALYREIIDDYPDSALAQECYWKLVTLYVKEENRESYEKAKALYQEFLSRYPDSKFRVTIEETLAMWQP